MGLNPPNRPLTRGRLWVTPMGPDGPRWNPLTPCTHYLAMIESGWCKEKQFLSVVSVQFISYQLTRLTSVEPMLNLLNLLKQSFGKGRRQPENISCLGRTFVLGVLFFASSLGAGLAATRQDILLLDGWKYIKADVGLEAATAGWQAVSLPHTWNTKTADESQHKDDAQQNPSYFRGACWYAKVLDIPAAWKGNRVFIRFEAASLVARTYLNGQLLGEHRGGFTAFSYELTDGLHYGATNELRVMVDNSHQEDVPPLSGDFNVNGGIYRPVRLLVTTPVCISPLNCASPGVYLTTKSLTDSAAQIEVKTLVSNGGANAADVRVKIDITDADGKNVATQEQPVSVASGKTQTLLSTLNLMSPHRWHGRKDPYLYTATVSLVQNHTVIDAVSQPLGLRTVAISEDRGFLLNDQPYPIYGVNRHQDWGDQGWAATPANYDQDAQIMLDLGVTAIRLAHYPQSDYWHNLCDHNGMLLWNEVPLVNEICDTPAFSANAEQQLRELILQLYNHPSVAFWGLFNEMSATETRTPDKLLQHLKSVVQELDSSRLIVCASDNLKQSFTQIADHPCYNKYPGWYSPFGRMGEMIKNCAADAGKRIAFSEYGAGANPAQHEEGVLNKPEPGGPFHPEEWQTHVHEDDWAVMKNNPLLWGSFVWVMFDFQVAARHEGSLPNRNDKGLVTQDRKIKKDAYFFYQANWSDRPMVHIASHRLTPRRQATTSIEVFSNCAKVELLVNGQPLAPVSPDNVRVFRWPNVTLQPGRNSLKATAISSGQTVTDVCEWVLEPGQTSP